MSNVDNPSRIIVFRTDKKRAPELYQELKGGRLRQGWGIPNMSLVDEQGKPISKEQWTQNYKSEWGEPSPRRYSLLRHMLDFKKGDVVVMPNLPEEYQQFSIARVSGDYRFETVNYSDGDDYGHIVPVDPASVRTFASRANTEAYTVHSLFCITKHRPAISFAYNQDHIKAALELLQKKDCTESKEVSEIAQASLDDAIEVAAKAMQEKIKSWNGSQFETAVRIAFENQGYEIVRYSRYDGKGADVDIVVRPPINNLKFFMPPEIAVQVKWKQGIDDNDVEAVDQLDKWDNSEIAQKFVISSASGFTDKCEKAAEEKDVILISGLDTMYFLMGLPNPVRSV